MEVEHRPDVQQAGGGVPVVADLQVERPHDRLEPGDVGGQIRRPDRRVFDKRDRFRRAFAPGEQREAGFAHRPDEVHLGRLRANGRAQPETFRGQERQPLRHVVVELNDENGFTRLVLQLE